MWEIEMHREETSMMAADPMILPITAKPLRAALILHDEGDKLERKEYIEE